VVKDQVTEMLYSLFHWASGDFEIQLRDHQAEERIVLTIPIEDVILEGTRRITDWGRIWRGVGGLDAVFAPTAVADSLGYRASLTDDEAHVLSLVKGRLDVRRILGLSYASNFETCRILWLLAILGAIERIDGQAPPVSQEED